MWKLETEIVESDYVKYVWMRGEIQVAFLFDMDRNLSIRYAGCNPIEYDVYRDMQQMNLLVDETESIASINNNMVADAKIWAAAQMAAIDAVGLR